MDQRSLRIKRLNVVLDGIIEGEEGHEKELFNIEKQLLEQDKPNVWNVWNENNMERQLEVDFRKFALATTEGSNIQLENLTTFTFYANVERLKEKHGKNGQ